MRPVSAESERHLQADRGRQRSVERASETSFSRSLRGIWPQPGRAGSWEVLRVWGLPAARQAPVPLTCPGQAVLASQLSQTPAYLAGSVNCSHILPAQNLVCQPGPHLTGSEQRLCMLHHCKAMSDHNVLPEALQGLSALC